jgi:trimeric autotransporter adhesin
METTTRTFIAIFLLTMPVFLYAQDINTVAGNYSLGAGYSGDGGQATAAQLHDPTCVAFDNTGDMYIADYQNNRIRSVSHSTGIISTVAGNGVQGYSGDGGQASAAEFYSPSGVAFDNSGNLYIVDAENYRIREVNASTGIITTIAGDGTAGGVGDNGQATAAEINCYGIAVDNGGDVFIADYGNSKIRLVTHSTGIITTIAGTGTNGSGGDGGQAKAAELNYAIGVGLDAAGNIYIADYANNKIREVSKSSGIINTIAGNGTQSYSGDGGQATAAELYYPTAIAVDASSNVYICDQYNNRIREITFTSGIINTIAGNGTLGFSGDGGPATASELNHPYGLSLDASANIYISDEFNNVIREIGSISTEVPGIVNSSLFTLFPNPAKNQIIVSFTSNSAENVELTIFDLTGRELSVCNVQMTSSNYTLDVSSLPAGMYFIKIQCRNGTIETQKFIKD